MAFDIACQKQATDSNKKDQEWGRYTGRNPNMPHCGQHAFQRPPGSEAFAPTLLGMLSGCEVTCLGVYPVPRRDVSEVHQVLLSFCEIGIQRC